MRISRLLVKDEDAIYHIITRTVLNGYVIGNHEKDYLLEVIKKMSEIFFVEVYGFCLMGNHFHLLLKMKTPDKFSDRNVKNRIKLTFKDKTSSITAEEVKYFREKFTNLSEFMREIKQRFSRFYNKRHMRTGYFWGDRFKSVILEKGETLINCLAYIDLNPIRANIVKAPENYKWSSFGYRNKYGNNDKFLSTDYAIKEFKGKSDAERVKFYKEFIYEKSAIKTVKEAVVKKAIRQKEGNKNFKATSVELLRTKSKFFTDSGIIGSEEFVRTYYKQFKDKFFTDKDKNPRKISGDSEMYALKNLRSDPDV